jgi:endonuclease YncB( thermonuclease family)
MTSLRNFANKVCSCCFHWFHLTPRQNFSPVVQREDVPVNLNTTFEFDHFINEYTHLQNVTWKDCKPYIPDVICGKVIKVYDGDTITIASRLHNSSDDTIYRFSVRLLGIDCAEMKSKNEIEKLHAVQARDALSAIVMGKLVILKNVTIEKYGRLLADVYYNNIWLNEWMLNNHYAVPYDGGTKVIPDKWINNKIDSN